MTEPARAATLRAIEPEPTPEPGASTDAQTTAVHHAGLQGYAIVVLAVIAAIAALRAAEGFVIPILLAVVIALALAPVVRVMSRWIPRSVSAALIVFAFVSLSTLTAYSLADDAAAVATVAPQVSRQLRQALRVAIESRQGHLFSQMQRALTELERAATESTEWTGWSSVPKGVTPVQLVEPPVDVRGVFWNGWLGLAGIGGQLVVVLFLTYFLLSFGSVFKRKLVKLSGDRLSRRRVTVDAIDQIVERVARSLLHLIITGVLVGLTTWLALASLGVRYAGLFGIAAGLLNAVPYLGPTAVAIAATLTALLQFGDLGMAALVGGVTIVITTIEGFWLTPVLFGRLARVNPVAVLVSALFLGWLWGAAGLLLSLPLLVIITTIAQSVDDLAPLAELLGE